MPAKQPKKKKGKTSNGQWEVEKIVSSRSRGGVTYYEVKWKGWATKHNTWEPTEHLTSCRALLNEFLKENEKKKEGTTKQKVTKGREKKKTCNTKAEDIAEESESDDNNTKTGRKRKGSALECEPKKKKKKTESPPDKVKVKTATNQDTSSSQPSLKDEVSQELQTPGGTTNTKIPAQSNNQSQPNNLIQLLPRAPVVTFSPSPRVSVGMHSMLRLPTGIPAEQAEEKMQHGKKSTDFFATGLPSNFHEKLPTLEEFHTQFVAQGICQLPTGIKPKFTKLLANKLKDKFSQIMHTILSKDLYKELEDQGFAEFKSRTQGRYDMMLRKEEFPFLTKNPPWLPLVRQILGPDAALTFIGCIMSLPGSQTQPYHSDGEHLSETEFLPAHCINVFVPLVDLSVANGPTQFVPTSHINWQTQAEPIILTPKAGTAILFDYRLKHRGLGNTTKEPRPLLYFTYAQPHFVDDENFSTERYLRLPELLPLQKNGREERAKKRALKKIYHLSEDDTEKKEKKKSNISKNEGNDSDDSSGEDESSVSSSE